MDLANLLWSKDVLVSVLVLLATRLAYSLWKAFLSIWWRPRRIKRVFEAQGIICMPNHFVYGNLPEFVAIGKKAQSLPMPEVSHDIAPRIIPHYYQWSKKYGDQFVCWIGSKARFNLTNPEQAKEVLSTKFGHYRKIGNRRPEAIDLIGKGGLLFLEGEKWAQHRRIMNPAFFLEKLKAMTPTMAACTAAMIEKWDASIEKGQDIDVHKELKNLTADIIAHTAFGSSFAEGKQVFKMQHEQQILFHKTFRSVYIPGTRFLPTPFNQYRWKINNSIVRVLHQLINKRLESIKLGDSYGNDLLGLMMAANTGGLQGNQKKLTMGIDDIMSECKTFFFAGHETTSTLLTWTFLLLASSPEWQERTREEVQAVCGMTDKPTAESVNHLKIVGMVLNEALRLYPPVVNMFRKVATDMQLGKIMIPAGTELLLPIIAWHHDQKYWGPDANEFRPERFSGGVSKACTVAGAFMPFSMGPRICIGQTFAILEAKVVLSTILQRYRFRLSPTYRHAPTTLVTLQPQFGMPILFEKL